MGKFLRERATVAFAVKFQAMQVFQFCNLSTQFTNKITEVIYVKPTPGTAPGRTKLLEEVEVSYFFVRLCVGLSFDKLKTKVSHIS